jgi:hypothetical protein
MKFERSQETKRPEMEGHDWRHIFLIIIGTTTALKDMSSFDSFVTSYLKETGGIKESSISTQTNDQIDRV